MSRPESIQDLADHEKTPHEFFRIDLQHLTRDVAVGAAARELIDAARRSEYFDVDEDGQFLVSVPLTEAELRLKVESAQRSWDYNRDAYEAALVGSRKVESWHRYSVDQWAKSEGLESIDWATHDERMAA